MSAWDRFADAVRDLPFEKLVDARDFIDGVIEQRKAAAVAAAKRRRVVVPDGCYYCPICEAARPLLAPCEHVNATAGGRAQMRGLILRSGIGKPKPAKR